jgi:hypothetical protein
VENKLDNLITFVTVTPQATAIELPLKLMFGMNEQQTRDILYLVPHMVPRGIENTAATKYLYRLL